LNRLDQGPLNGRVEGRLAAGHPVQGLLDLGRARVLSILARAPPRTCSRPGWPAWSCWAR
jgi:hypothetical protein